MTAHLPHLRQHQQQESAPAALIQVDAGQQTQQADNHEGSQQTRPMQLLQQLLSGAAHRCGRTCLTLTDLWTLPATYAEGALLAGLTCTCSRLKGKVVLEYVHVSPARGAPSVYVAGSIHKSVTVKHMLPHA